MTRAKFNSIEPDPDYYLNFSTYLSDQQWAVISDQATYMRVSVPRGCDSGERRDGRVAASWLPEFQRHSEENVAHVITVLFCYSIKLLNRSHESR